MPIPSIVFPSESQSAARPAKRPQRGNQTIQPQELEVLHKCWLRGLTEGSFLMNFSTPKLAETFYAQLFRAKGLYNKASPTELNSYSPELMEAFSSVRIVWGDGSKTGEQRPKRGTSPCFRLVSDIRQGKPEYVEALRALESPTAS